MSGTGGLAFGFPGIPGPTDISDIIHYFEHDKSSFISQLIANQEISKNYSDILMEQQLLHLICYYRLVCFLLFFVLY